METEIVKLNKDTHAKDANMAKLKQELADSTMKLEKSLCDITNQKEKMILYETAEKNKSLQPAENILNELQIIWSQLGVSDGERRERATRKLDTCLEDTCNDLLQEAKDLQRRKNEEISIKQKQILNMLDSLGCDENERSKIQNLDQESSMIHRMAMLQDIHHQLHPKYVAALQRRETLIKDVKTILKTMEPLEFDLKDNLQLLLNTQGKCLKHKKKKTWL